MLRALALLLALAAPAAAQDAAPPLTVSGATIPETTPVARTAAGYLRVTNDSGETYRLTGIEAGFPAAEFHETVTEGGVARMEPREDGFEIAPGQTLVLAPGGKHVMFMGLDRPLAAGTEVKATLLFGDALRLPVTFDVAPRSGSGHDSGHGSDHTSGHGGVKTGTAN